MRAFRSLLFVAILLSLQPAVRAGVPFTPGADDSPNRPAVDWLEPRGLNIVDLVGLVPESHLTDAILSFSGVGGIVQYVSGQRTGDTVVIQTRISPGYLPNNTIFNCLGQIAALDQWPSNVPAGRMQLFADGVDITTQIAFFEFFTSGQVLPVQNTQPGQAGADRYQKNFQQPSFTDGKLQLPANSGCNIFLNGHVTANLTATFTFTLSSPIAMQHLGSETFTFHSYVGPGFAGQLESLRAQMEARFPGIRHDKFTLTPPAEAEYLLVHIPPTPANAGAFEPLDRNLTRPTSGSYRLLHRDGNLLSVDHTNLMGLPLQGQYKDADLSPGVEFLPRIVDVDQVASPEYFVPPGVAYDPCMTNGGCPDSLLDQIWNATASLTVHYYKVTRTDVGLDRIPIQPVGPGWSPAGRNITRPSQPVLFIQDTRLYLPTIFNPAVIPPDDTAGCPCGWFTADGRMLDFIPAP